MKLLGQRLITALLITLFFAPLTQAKEDPVYTSLFSNAAAGGYDVVAYFTENKPVKGEDEFKTEYKGADWYFSSAENLQAFTENPEQYAPQYGGYCSYAIAKGTLAKGDPKNWDIYNGKLYLNYNSDIQSQWREDKDGFITQAEQNWPNILN